jgi:dienelactone hydrolase
MKNHPWSWHLVVLLLLSVCLLSGCKALQPASALIPTSLSGITNTHQVTAEEISFTTEDEVKLAGTLYLLRESNIAVVLAHQGTTGADQRTWQPFAKLIAEKGFTALTFDFRGRGQSEGFLRVERLDKDIRAAIEFLHNQGFKRIVCIGASMGGSACLKTALDTDLTGLVIIASPMNLGHYRDVGPEDFPKLTMPKLYVCAENDTADGHPTGLANPITSMYKISPEPKGIRLFPGTAHGTELFDTEYGNEFRELLVDFLEGLR